MILGLEPDKGGIGHMRDRKPDQGAEIFGLGLRPCQGLTDAGQKGKVFRRQFRRLAMGAFLGLQGGLPSHLRQFNEDADLGLQYFGHDRCRQKIDGAGGIALGDVHLVGKGGQEDDGRGLRLAPLADQAGRFIAVHGRHVDVEQDDGKVVLKHQFQGFFARRRRDQGLTQFFEDGLIDQKIAGPIVHQKNFFRRRRCCRGRGHTIKVRVEGHQRCNHARSTVIICSESTGFDR